MKKIIMILTNGFYSDPRVYKEAEYYIAQGCEVEILCWDRDCKYDIDEIRDGIKIHRFHIKSKYGSGLKKQLRAYLKFRKSCLKYLKHQNYDILHCHDLDGALVGLKVRKKIVKIFDMHEYYLVYENKLLNFIFGKIVRKVQNKFDYIIYLNDKQKKDIRKNNLNKLIFLPNYPEKNLFGDNTKSLSDKIRVAFVGNNRYIKSSMNMIQVCQKYGEIEMHFYGFGVLDLKEFADKNIIFHGKYEYRELCDIYKNVDIINCVYDSTVNDGFPNKFYEALITHTPLLVDVNSVRSEFIKKYDVGYIVDVNDISTYYNVFEKILQNKNSIIKKVENMNNIKESYTWEDVVVNLKTSLNE